MNYQLMMWERGWPGHLCVAPWCSFRRNTLLQFGETRIVVSTVGRYTPRRGEDCVEIGHNRHYETMAFFATWTDPYWDADVQREIGINGQWQLQGVTFQSDALANDMHDNVIDEIADRLRAGELVSSCPR